MTGITGSVEFFRGVIRVHCYRCARAEDIEIVNRIWLTPIYVWEKHRPGYWRQSQLCPRCARWSLRYWIKVRWRLRIGRFLSELLGPKGYSSCGCCGTTWWFAKSHATDYTIPGEALGHGCFPLCQRCWEERTPAARLPYYEQLWDEWAAEGYPKSAAEHVAMVQAVLAGK